MISLLADKIDVHGSPALGCRNELQALQYETIGETLLSCEASCHRIGIPWLPPTTYTQKLVKQFDPPLEDYIRYSMVTVSTKTLVSYCDDLEDAELTIEAAEQLHIAPPSVLERYAFAVLVFGILFAADYMLINLLTIPAYVAIGSSLIVALCGATACLMLSTEQHRRKTFHWILSHELDRRHGLNDDDQKRIRLMSVEAEPVVE